MNRKENTLKNVTATGARIAAAVAVCAVLSTVGVVIRNKRKK